MKWKIIALLTVIHLAVAALNLKIGFDYDDTLSLSTPAFEQAFSSQNQGIKPFSNEFWKIVNTNYKLEQPKVGVIFWAALAKFLGFDIIVIASRVPIEADNLVASWDWLADGFFFEKEKSKILRRHHYLAFVGDADSDIEEARKANVLAIRAQRSPSSSYKENYSPGKYGEWVLPYSG